MTDNVMYSNRVIDPTKECVSSGHKTADGVISARACTIKAVQMFGDGTNTTEVVLYDNASAASGTVLYHGKCGKDSSQLDFLPEVFASNGIYADVSQSGTSAGFIVYCI